MRKKGALLFAILLLLLFVPPGASQELRLELAPGVLEKLSAEGSEFYLEWSTYRNT